MEKKLPKIFANKLEKNVSNNKNVYYSADKNEQLNTIEEKSVKNKMDSNLNINQKINKIFTSTKYVYKADVRINTKNEQIDCRIIGKNATHLITMDNKLIPISDIVDINLLEK